MSQIEQNTTALEALLNAVNNLPDAEGGGSAEPILQEKSVTPTESTQNVTPDSGYDGLSKVIVNPIPSEYIVPSGTKSITENGTHDVKDYASVSVNVASSGGNNELLMNIISRSTADFSITASELQGLTSIGDYAFYNCQGLISISIPSGITSIGNNAFNNCYRISNIDIPFGVESIGNNAFWNNVRLTTLELPSSVASIGNSFLYGCTNFTTLKCNAIQPPIITTSTFNSVKNYIQKIIVPAGRASTYKWATNWSALADIIVEEA